MQLIEPNEVAALLRRNKERLRVSRLTNRECCDSLRQSREAIARSRLLLSRGDVMLQFATPWATEPLSLAPERAVAAAPAAEARRAPAAGGKGRTEAAADLMETVKDRTFADTRVLLDGRRFVDCTVQNCTLEFNGGPVEIEATRFVDCRFEFGGDAGLTVRFLECFGFFEGAAPEYGLGPVRTKPSGFVN